MARQLPRLRPKVVVGYEACCVETFKVAKELGIICVLDAAAFHYVMQDRILSKDLYAAPKPGQASDCAIVSKKRLDVPTRSSVSLNGHRTHTSMLE